MQSAVIYSPVVVERQDEAPQPSVSDTTLSS